MVSVFLPPPDRCPGAEAAIMTSRHLPGACPVGRAKPRAGQARLHVPSADLKHPLFYCADPAAKYRF